MVFRLFRSFSVTILALNAVPAIAQESWHATPWVKAASSEVRLIVPAGKVVAGAKLHAAIEMRLPQGAKTYWRTAGETGVPPTFNFSASTGLSKPEVLFPAPVAFDDGVGGLAYGYVERATLPISLIAEKPDAKLAVAVDYGVCLKAMCVPAQATLTAPLGGESGDAALGESMSKLLAELPRPVALGAASTPAVITLLAKKKDKAVHVLARIRSKAGAPQVFFEAEEVFSIVSTRPLPGGESEVLAKAERSGDAAKPLGPVRLTIVDGGAAIDVTASLDQALEDAQKAGVSFPLP